MVNVLKKKPNGLSKWMVLSNPEQTQQSIMILRGHYPQYIFEIIQPGSETNHQLVEFKGDTYQIAVRRDIDEKGIPPVSYLIEMLLWYQRARLNPKLSNFKH